MLWPYTDLVLLGRERKKGEAQCTVCRVYKETSSRSHCTFVTETYYNKLSDSPYACLSSRYETDADLEYSYSFAEKSNYTKHSFYLIL